MHSFAPFCALCGLALALFCALLCSFAYFRVRPRLQRPRLGTADTLDYFGGIFGFFRYFRGLFCSRPPKRHFLRLVWDFRPEAAGDSCKWSLAVQRKTLKQVDCMHVPVFHLLGDSGDCLPANGPDLANWPLPRPWSETVVSIHLFADRQTMFKLCHLRPFSRYISVLIRTVSEYCSVRVSHVGLSTK